jgi:aspartyl-tRNA(Asn)/glutamyl-tRNA(Gln) amidotransferase subunit A
MSSSVADPGSLKQLQRDLQAGRTDPVRLLQQSLARIDAVEDRVQGWRIVDRGGAMEQATKLRQEFAAGTTPGTILGPLHGIPVAIKDVIDVAGFPTRAGSRTREHVAPSHSDATIVARLRAAGAIIVGKAHTTEFAYFDGPPPTRNPHDLARTPGGSSAGPAAVVAAGMVPLSIGTQTAGSVSRPAAYCGIAAFKPSTLAWPTFGVVPFAPSFDTVGVFGHRTADATTAMRTLMPPFLPPAPHRPSAAAVTVGIVQDSISSSASDAVRQNVRSVAEKLAAAGTRTPAWQSPVGFAEILAWHKTISEFELARAHPSLIAAPPGQVTPALLEAVERGSRIDASFYNDALRALDRARAHFWKAFEGYEALLFPAAPDVAPLGMKTGDPRFIIPFTALGGPIVSIPAGFDQKLPLGVMLAGSPGTDGALADLADRLAPQFEVAR